MFWRALQSVFISKATLTFISQFFRRDALLVEIDTTEVSKHKRKKIYYILFAGKRGNFFSADAKIDHNKYNKLKCSNWNKNELAFVLIFGRERGKRKYWTKRTTTVVLSKWKTMSGKHIEAIRIKKEPGQDEVDSSSNSTSSNATEPTRQSSLQRIQLRKERVWKIITF